MSQRKPRITSAAQLEIIKTYPEGRLMRRGDEQGGQVSLVDHRGVVGFDL